MPAPPPPPAPPAGPQRFVVVLHGVIRDEAQARTWTAARIHSAFFRALPPSGYPVVGQDVRIVRVIRDVPEGDANAVLAARAQDTRGQAMLHLAQDAIPELRGSSWAARAGQLAIVAASLHPAIALARQTYRIGSRRLGSQLVTVAALIEVAPGVGYNQAKDALYAGMAREFPQPVWTSVKVGPYDPAVNGGLQFWQTPAVPGGKPPAFATRTRDAVMTLSDSIAFDEENPIGPNRGAGSPVDRAAGVVDMLRGVVRDATPDVQAAAAVTTEVTQQVAAGLAQAGRTLADLPRRAGSALEDLLWGALKWGAILTAGAAGTALLGTWAYGASTGQTFGEAAGDLAGKGNRVVSAAGELAGKALLLTPAGRAAALASAVAAPRGNPAPAPPRVDATLALLDRWKDAPAAERAARRAAYDAAWRALTASEQTLFNELRRERGRGNPAPLTWKVLPASHPYTCRSRFIGKTPPGRRGETISACATPTKDRPHEGQFWTGFPARGFGTSVRKSTVYDRFRAGKRGPVRADDAASVAAAVAEIRGRDGVPGPTGTEYPHRVGSAIGDPEHAVWKGYTSALEDAEERAAVRLADEPGESPAAYRREVRAALAAHPRFEQWREAAQQAAKGFEDRQRAKVPKLGRESFHRERMQARAHAVATGQDVTDAEYRDTLDAATRARLRTAGTRR